MGLLPKSKNAILREELVEIRNQREIDRNNNVFLVERMAELELQLEDVGWLSLTYGTEKKLSRDALGKIAYLSRLYYLKNPIVNRGVAVKQSYVWGSGITVQSKNEVINEVIQEFWNDTKNRQELTSHNAQMLKELDL